jgi:hypothetical protein
MQEEPVRQVQLAREEEEAVHLRQWGLVRLVALGVVTQQMLVAEEAVVAPEQVLQ